MTGRALAWGLVLLVPPGAAFVLGTWSATSEQTGSVTEPTLPTLEPAHDTAQPPPPPPDVEPGLPPCDDPLMHELDSLEARWEEEQREAAFRQARLEDALYDALEQCDIGLDVVELDCREAPCVVITKGGDTNWWNSLAVCPAWYDLYGGLGAYHSNAVPCGGGGEESYEAVTEPLSFYGLQDDTELDDPELVMRALRLQGYEVTARIQELAAEWTCEEPDGP